VTPELNTGQQELNVYTIHSGRKVPPKCNAIYKIKYKEGRLDVLDCVTPRKAKNQSMEKCKTREDNVIE
jgi:hypothetical protein